MALLAVFITISVFHAAWGFGFENIDSTDKYIKIKDAPHMALLFTDLEAPCGGVIVNKNFIITSETCCHRNEQNPRPVWRARVGTTGNHGSRGDVKILRRADNETHTPGLKPTICILQLEKPLSYNEEVHEIPLDDGKAYLVEGKALNFTAYKADVARHTSVLHQLTLRVNAPEWCKKDAQNLKNAIFCAGDQKDTACYGNPGGVLTANNTLVGVLSTASPDCQSPARFSRIAYYRRWILDTMKKLI